MRQLKYMKCGHTANAAAITNKDGKTIDICCMCWGFTPDAEIEVDPPDFTGRKAKCDYCGRTVDSNLGLAFFGYRPNNKTDVYYCGCRGWD